MAEQVEARLGADLAERTVAVWGLSFKPNTDDMREAPSRVLIEAVWAAGGNVKAFDPKAMEACQAIYGPRDDMHYCATKEEALDNADYLVICTQWRAFKAPDFEDIKRRLASPVIIDGRNLYNPEDMEAAGIKYFGIRHGRCDTHLNDSLCPAVESRVTNLSALLHHRGEGGVPFVIHV